jgi:hypothetical protein
VGDVDHFELASECKKPPTMGLSLLQYHSQDHGFQSFPVELIIDILLHLSLHDLTTCPNSTLSLSERRAALARRQKAWDTGTPQCITTGKNSDLPDVNQSGLYFKLFQNHVAYRLPPPPYQAWDGSWSCLSPLPRRDLSTTAVALAVCLEENDLVAVGIR